MAVYAVPVCLLMGVLYVTRAQCFMYGIPFSANKLKCAEEC